MLHVLNRPLVKKNYTCGIEEAISVFACVIGYRDLTVTYSIARCITCMADTTIVKNPILIRRIKRVHLPTPPVFPHFPHSHNFPTVSKMALKYLAIPASGTPSERTKLILERKRWRMDSARLERVLLLRCLNIPFLDVYTYN